MWAYTSGRGEVHFGAVVLAPSFWRRRFGADVLAPLRFGAVRFGAKHGRRSFWRQVWAPVVLAPSTGTEVETW